MKVGDANSDSDDVEHAGKRRDARRHGEEERLIARHVETEIPRAVLVVADRLQDQAGAGLDQQPRGDEDDRQRDGDEIVGLDQIRIELEVERA